MKETCCRLIIPGLASRSEVGVRRQEAVEEERGRSTRESMDAAASPICSTGSPARTFRDLLVWRRAHEVALAVYSFTAGFPKSEAYGLAAQMRRSAVSIPTNIAEGFRRRGRADKARFMNVAEGSLEETRYYLILAHDLGCGDSSQVTVLLEEVSRLLHRYAKALRSDPGLLTPVS